MRVSRPNQSQCPRVVSLLIVFAVFSAVASAQPTNNSSQVEPQPVASAAQVNPQQPTVIKPAEAPVQQTSSSQTAATTKQPLNDSSTAAPTSSAPTSTPLATSAAPSHSGSHVDDAKADTSAKAPSTASPPAPKADQPQPPADAQKQQSGVGGNAPKSGGSSTALVVSLAVVGAVVSAGAIGGFVLYRFKHKSRINHSG